MKKVPLLLLCWLHALAAVCAAEYAVEVRTDRPDALYRQGEKAVFYFNVKENAVPLKDAHVFWRITKDGKEPVMDSGTLTLSDGTGSLSGALQEPGFLQCRIDFKTPEGKALNNRAGAAYDPLDIRASRSTPADFDTFWDAQKALLKTLPLNLVLTPVKNGDPSVLSYDVQADCGDTHISAYLSLPADAQPKSLPAIITLQGAGVRNANLSKTVQWAKDGFIALDFNVHGVPNDKPIPYYDALYKNELKDYFAKNRDRRETHFFRGLYLRLMRSIDILTARHVFLRRNPRDVRPHGPDGRPHQRLALQPRRLQKPERTGTLRSPIFRLRQLRRACKSPRPRHRRLQRPHLPAHDRICGLQ